MEALPTGLPGAPVICSERKEVGRLTRQPSLGRGTPATRSTGEVPPKYRLPCQWLFWAVWIIALVSGNCHRVL